MASAPLHEQALNAIREAYQAGRSLWISRQVLREFVAARTRPQTFAQPSAPELVIERVRYLENHFQVADDTAAVTEHLVKLLDDFQVLQINRRNISHISKWGFDISDHQQYSRAPRFWVQKANTESS